MRQYKNIGIDTIYDYTKNENVDSKIFVNDLEVLVSKDFIKNNQDNKFEWDRKNITLVEKNEEDLV